MSRRLAPEAVSQIGSYGFEAEQGQASASGTTAPGRSFDLRGTFNSLASRLGKVAASRSRSLSDESLNAHLRAAGFYTTPAGRFVGYQALAALTGGLFWLWFTVTAGMHPIIAIAGLVAAVAGGWTLPLTYVKRRGRARGEQVDYRMPDLIDMLVTTVEAGLSFSSSLQVAAKRFRGPLGDELRLTLQEQSMGLAVNDSLKNLVSRCDTPSMRSFVRAIVQGEQLGVSIGNTLRNLATEMRTRRRQMAEEKAHKAPVKLVFPLILFIFPATMLVMLGPAFIRIQGIFD
jgi:tight adherence protein C